MTMIKVSAFRWVPPFAQGLVRDLRVRWALEEAGLAYEERLIGPADQKSDGYRALQPFGQVPSYEENGLELFESGAIVLHVAERAESLMPPEPVARARTKTWMFAALNTVEPPIVFLNAVNGTPDAEQLPLKQGVVGLVEQRLDSLCSQLSGRDYLEYLFTAADLLMTSVLRDPADHDDGGRTALCSSSIVVGAKIAPRLRKGARRSDVALRRERTAQLTG